MSKVWFITGVSSGFGQVLTEEVINSGDVVVGTLRKPEQVAEFNKKYSGKASAVLMDVTNIDQIAAAIKQTLALHQRIDVLVNNAGFGLLGAIEEVSLPEAHAQMETNFFGALATTQHVLPIMRKQRAGHIVQFSSIAGLTSTPGLGLYNASKFALEGFSEALALEVAEFNIKVTLVEPGPFRTHFVGASAKRADKIIDDYDPVTHARIQGLYELNGKQDGDPRKAAKVILQIVQSKQPPLRLPLGTYAIDRTRQKLLAIEKDIAAWEKISAKTSFSDF